MSPSYTDVLPLDFPARVDLPDLFLESSPRASIRVDTRDRDGKWRHVYVDRARPSRQDHRQRQPHGVGEHRVVLGRRVGGVVSGMLSPSSALLRHG
jgi:hypothetical protein